MTFHEMYLSVKEKFGAHPEIMLKCSTLTVQIIDKADPFSHAFYLLWKNNKCILDQYHCDEYDICITGTQEEIEKMFTEQQYLVQEQHQLAIEGTFQNVMLFQKMLSYITSENTYLVQEEIISHILSEQAAARKDLDIIMQTLHLIFANSLISLPESFPVSSHQETKQETKPVHESKSKPQSQKTYPFNCGQIVKLSPSCKVYYDHDGKTKHSIYDLFGGPYAKIYSIVSVNDSQYELCWNSPAGNRKCFLVNKNMVIPVD